ncbi:MULTISPECIES: hypothetical protein [Streptomyces]|uniref:hypothetical protein n=1 Tax=Streptomyces TaxID=1883 RepID=UPI0004C7BA8B|nr:MULTISPECIES: hypothetical protein [Streptomyces]MDX2919316.1 hypothetical protein [Streptomyces sp. NE06-03C]MDX3607226.1 hypothetical protein [Streptomyces sp. FL06-04B]MDX3737088.1 hypothetical protein [Streptomyces sp. ID01-15D]
MSRTQQWCSLTALLAVVLGLLCGPAASTAAGAGDAAGPVVHAAQGRGQAPHPVDALARDRAQGSAPAQAPHRTRVPGHAPVAEAAGAGAPVPGCGKLRDHDGEPAVPSRARSVHDHAPGLAPWGLPAATGALPAEPPPGIRVRAPLPYTPTPVELSVLRV